MSACTCRTLWLLTTDSFFLILGSYYMLDEWREERHIPLVWSLLDWTGHHQRALKSDNVNYDVVSAVFSNGIRVWNCILSLVCGSKLWNLTPLESDITIELLLVIFHWLSWCARWLFFTNELKNNIHWDRTVLQSTLEPIVTPKMWTFVAEKFGMPWRDEGPRCWRPDSKNFSLFNIPREAAMHTVTGIFCHFCCSVPPQPTYCVNSLLFGPFCHKSLRTWTHEKVTPVPRTRYLGMIFQSTLILTWLRRSPSRSDFEWMWLFECGGGGQGQTLGNILLAKWTLTFFFKTCNLFTQNIYDKSGFTFLHYVIIHHTVAVSFSHQVTLTSPHLILSPVQVGPG